MAANNFSIEKLTRRNFARWVKDMKYLLIDKNCYNLVTEKEKKPAIEDKTKESLLKDWEMRERSAMSLIYLNIETELKTIIENCDDAVDAWKVICRHFKPDNRSHQMSRYSDYLACRIFPEEDIDLFSSRLCRITDELNEFADKVPETFKCFQLIRHLPERFDSIVQNILRWSESDFKYDKILNELIAEESRLNLRDRDRYEDKYPEVQMTRRRQQCRKCLSFSHLTSKCGNYLNKGITSRGRSTTPNRDRFTDRSPDPEFRGSYQSRNTFRGRGRAFKGNIRNFRSSKFHRSTSSSSNGSTKLSCLTEACYTSADDDCSAWVFDSAATHHFCNSREHYTEFTPVAEKLSVAVADVSCPIRGTGTVTLSFNNKSYNFRNVLFAPSLRKNLISGPQLDRKGFKFIGERGEVRVSHKSKPYTLFTAKLKNGIYYLFPENFRSRIPKKVSFETSNTQMETWHKRLAHVSSELIENTSKNKGVKGLPNLKKGGFFCEDCQLNKQRRVSFKSHGGIRSKKPLELLVLDVWGPVKYKGRKGERFFLSILDDFSKRVSIYPLQTKANIYKIFEEHVKRAERFLNTKVISIRTDNGTEFDNQYFEAFSRKNGIKHEFTNYYSPEQNGSCERFNQTVMDGVRTILSSSKVPFHFWPDAAIYFAYTWNRVCHRGQCKTPFELYSGNKPSVKHLRPFGITAYVGIPKQIRKSKLDAKAKKGLFIGYAFRTKGFRIWVPEDHRVIETLNVKFRESDTEDNDCSGAALGPSSNSLNQSQIETGCEDEKEVQYGPSYPLTRTSSEETDEENTSDGQSDDIPLRKVNWERVTKRRTDNSRNDIYYYEQNKTKRLRSLNDIQKYCTDNHINFEPSIFDFQGSNTYSGLVQGSLDNISSASASLSHRESK
jgi:hypothetical protein